MNRQRKGLAVLEGRPNTPEQRRRAIEAELRALPELEKRPQWCGRRSTSVLMTASSATSFSEKGVCRGRHCGRRGGAIGRRPSVPAAFRAGGPGFPDRRRLAVAGPNGSGSGARAARGRLMERSRLAETRRRSMPVFEGARLAAAPGFGSAGSDSPGIDSAGFDNARRMAAGNRLPGACLLPESLVVRCIAEPAGHRGATPTRQRRSGSGGTGGTDGHALMRAEQVQRRILSAARFIDRRRSGRHRSLPAFTRYTTGRCLKPDEKNSDREGI